MVPMAMTMPLRSRLKPTRQECPTSSIQWLLAIGTLLSFVTSASATPKGAQDFVNNSMPTIRPIFVVNFGMSSVVCQSTLDESDIVVQDISILCDGKKDCFDNPAMNDESFPYCGKSVPSRIGFVQCFFQR